MPDLEDGPQNANIEFESDMSLFDDGVHFN